MPGHIFFDYCDTLYKGQSLQSFIDYLHSIKKPRNISSQLYKGFMRLPLGSSIYKKLAFKSLSGISSEEVNSICRDFFYDVLMPLHHRGIFTLLEKHCSQGDRVSIVSGGCAEYLNYIKDVSCVSDVIATKLVFNELDRLIGYPNNECLGFNKIAYIENYFYPNTINWDECTFYTDSITDLPLLSIVGRAVVVGMNAEPPIWAQGKFEYLNLLTMK